jgi:hypothetical protein
VRYLKKVYRDVVPKLSKVTPIVVFETAAIIGVPFMSAKRE